MTNFMYFGLASGIQKGNKRVRRIEVILKDVLLGPQLSIQTIKKSFKIIINLYLVFIFIKGDHVQLGYSFWTDSTCAQKCTCTSAGLQCSNEPCAFSQICQQTSFQYSCQTVQRRTCTISGDPHYYTFDNQVFHFQGTCTYVLSEQCQNDLPYYRVEGKNENRGSTQVSWTRLVKVFIYNEMIELVNGHNGEAKVSRAVLLTTC